MRLDVAYSLLLVVGPLLCTVACGPRGDLGDFLGFEDKSAAFGLPQEQANGVCVADFNGDGLPDVFFARNGDDRLYLNDSGSSFVSLTVPAAEGDDSQGCGTADFDQDGDIDLVVSAQYGLSRFLRNDGTGGLVDDTQAAGLGNTFNQRSVLSDDIDGDGWVDLVLTSTQQGQAGLYRNRGDGSFEDLSAASPVEPVRRSWGGALFDYDNDGLVDLFLAKDIRPELDQLFHNDGDFQFTEVTPETGLSNINHSMGIAVADLDADGWLDFYVTNWGYHAMWKNLGEGQFLEVAGPWGIGTSGGASGWGTFFVDADNDGDQDLFVANGAGFLVGDPNNPVSPPNEKNRFFLNDPESDDSPLFYELAADAGLNDKGSALGAAWGDFDADGWVDIIVANRAKEPSRMYRNLGTSGERAPPLRVLLKGAASNPDAYGARVTVEACEHRQVRLRTHGASVLSGGEAALHFGLASCEQETVAVDVQWPAGTTERFDLSAAEWGDLPVTLVEGTGTAVDSVSR